MGDNLDLLMLEQNYFNNANGTKVLSFGINGVDGFPVSVEVYSANGLPAMDIIGLPDTSVKESKDRVVAAVANSDKEIPPRRITVNLAPADMKKEGPSFDLPIAVGVLVSNGQINLRPELSLDETVFFGELSLDGRLNPVHGALSIVISAREKGYTDVVLPADNAKEVACVEGMNIYPAKHLTEVIRHLDGTEPILPQAQIGYEEMPAYSANHYDLKDVKGQQFARQALEVAAAGGHNLLMIGSPGSGKTMMARCLPGILPPMTFEESLETTRIHSIAGKLTAGSGLMVERPYCAPHHSASVSSLIGGGPNAKPGEISLAHNGVLFLDELPEFNRAALEALRQPLEDGFVSVTRVKRQAVYQSSFMLIAGMNPCPCGYAGGAQQDKCHCTELQKRKYLSRISGPLLDRFDLRIEINPVPLSEIRDIGSTESSAEVAKRVARAREIQQKRYAGTPIHCNAQLDNRSIELYCHLDHDADLALNMAVDRMRLSMRAYGRLIKVARTIADLRGDDDIHEDAMMQALGFRNLNEKYWG